MIETFRSFPRELSVSSSSRCATDSISAHSRFRCTTRQIPRQFSESEARSVLTIDTRCLGSAQEPSRVLYVPVARGEREVGKPTIALHGSQDASEGCLASGARCHKAPRVPLILNTRSEHRSRTLNERLCPTVHRTYGFVFPARD